MVGVSFAGEGALAAGAVSSGQKRLLAGFRVDAIEATVEGVASDPAPVFGGVAVPEPAIADLPVIGDFVGSEIDGNYASRVFS